MTPVVRNVLAVVGAVALLAVGLWLLAPATVAATMGGGVAHGGMTGGGMMGGDVQAMHRQMGALAAQMQAHHQQVMAVVAQKLGMTVAELTAALEGGKTMAALAQEKGVAWAEIEALMMANAELVQKHVRLQA